MKNWPNRSFLFGAYLSLLVFFSVASAQNLVTDTVLVKLVDEWLFVPVTVGDSMYRHESHSLFGIHATDSALLVRLDSMAIGGMRHAFYDVFVMVNPFSSNTKVGARILEYGVLIIYSWHWMRKKRMLFQPYAR